MLNVAAKNDAVPDIETDLPEVIWVWLPLFPMRTLAALISNPSRETFSAKD